MIATVGLPNDPDLSLVRNKQFSGIVHKTFGHWGDNAENNNAGWRLPESPDKVTEEKRELSTEIPQLQTHTDGLKFLRCVLEEISPEAIKFKLPEIRPSPHYKVS